MKGVKLHILRSDGGLSSARAGDGEPRQPADVGPGRRRRGRALDRAARRLQEPADLRHGRHLDRRRADRERRARRPVARRASAT